MLYISDCGDENPTQYEIDSTSDSLKMTRSKYDRGWTDEARGEVVAELKDDGDIIKIKLLCNNVKGGTKNLIIDSSSLQELRILLNHANERDLDSSRRRFVWKEDKFKKIEN